MKKFKHLGTTVQFGTVTFFQLTTFDESKKLRYWLVSVDYSKDESEWLVRIFSTSYYGKYYDVRVLNNVYTERFTYKCNSPSRVACLVFKHYLSFLSKPGSDDLPF